MSDKTETVVICGAAGDPCTAQVMKPSEVSEPAKTETPQITTISEEVLTQPNENKNSLTPCRIGDGLNTVSIYW